MAFSLEGNPATAVQGVSQVSSVVLDGLSTVTDNDGNPAPKGSVLGPVRSLEGDLKTDLVGLKGDFTDVSGSDKLNVSASYSLLVSLDKVQQLCDKFTGSLSNAGDVSNKLNDYIATIIHRNAVVNEFNIAIQQWLDLKTAADRMNAQYAPARSKISDFGRDRPRRGRLLLSGVACSYAHRVPPANCRGCTGCFTVLSPRCGSARERQ